MQPNDGFHEPLFLISLCTIKYEEFFKNMKKSKNYLFMSVMSDENCKDKG